MLNHAKPAQHFDDTRGLLKTYRPMKNFLKWYVLIRNKEIISFQVKISGVKLCPTCSENQETDFLRIFFSIESFLKGPIYIPDIKTKLQNQNSGAVKLCLNLLSILMTQRGFLKHFDRPMKNFLNWYFLIHSKQICSSQIKISGVRFC